MLLLKNRNIIKVALYILPFIFAIVLQFYFENRYSSGTRLFVKSFAQLTFGLEKDSISNTPENNPRSYAPFTSFPSNLGITIGDKSCRNFIIINYQIKNEGRLPIKLDDYEIPLIVICNKGSKLLSVETINASDQFALPIWNICFDSTSAEMQPVLLNPSDWLEVCIAYEYTPQIEKSRLLDWYAKITGLSSLEILNESNFDKKNDIIPVTIVLHGIEAIQGLLIIIILFVLSYIVTFRNRTLSDTKNFIFVLTSIVIMSICSGVLLTSILIIKHFNAEFYLPIFILHISFLVYYNLMPKIKK